MADNEPNEFEWTFRVSSALDMKEEPTEITVYAYTYKQAIRKVVSLKLPDLEKVSDADQYLNLVRTAEMAGFKDLDNGEQFQEDSKN